MASTFASWLFASWLPSSIAGRRGGEGGGAQGVIGATTEIFTTWKGSELDHSSSEANLILEVCKKLPIHLVKVTVKLCQSHFAA